MNATLEQQLVLKLDVAALTDCGRKRKLNEDAVFHYTVQTLTVV